MRAASAPGAARQLLAWREAARKPHGWCGEQPQCFVVKARCAGGWRLLLPLQPQAGARSKPGGERACGIVDAIHLCRRMCIACQLQIACRSLGTSDAQLLRAVRCVMTVDRFAYRLAQFCNARAMGQLRGCAREEDRAHLECDLYDAVPSLVVKSHVPCGRNARVVCPNEYAVSFIHQVRPLNR